MPAWLGGRERKRERQSEPEVGRLTLAESSPVETLIHIYTDRIILIAYENKTKIYLFFLLFKKKLRNVRMLDKNLFTNRKVILMNINPGS